VNELIALIGPWTNIPRWESLYEHYRTSHQHQATAALFVASRARAIQRATQRSDSFKEDAGDLRLITAQEGYATTHDRAFCVLRDQLQAITDGVRKLRPELLHLIPRPDVKAAAGQENVPGLVRQMAGLYGQLLAAQTDAGENLDAYREGGKPNGQLLTTARVEFLFNLAGPAISKLPNGHPLRSTRKKNPHGRGFIYRHDLLAMNAASPKTG